MNVFLKKTPRSLNFACRGQENQHEFLKKILKISVDRGGKGCVKMHPT